MTEIVVSYWQGRWEDVIAEVSEFADHYITVRYAGLSLMFDRHTGTLLSDYTPPCTVGVPHICLAELGRFEDYVKERGSPGGSPIRV